MSGGTEVATERGLPLRWWHAVAFFTGVWALFVATVDLGGSIPTGADDALTLLALVGWPAIPVAMYLDVRAIRDEAAWKPATVSWLVVSLVWFANVSAGVAYCLRRASAVRGDVPSGNWRYGVYAGLVGWVALLGTSYAMDYGYVEEPALFGPALFVVWFGFPVALYLDAVRVRSYSDLTPNLRILVALSAVPLLNVLLGASYVGGRWWHVRKLDPDAEPTLPESGGTGPTGRGALSPWYRRAGGVFVVYFVAVVAAGSWLSLESDLAWNLLGLVLWPPFGLAFVGCIHLDLRDVRRAGVPWGETRYLYYLSVVIPAAAFWYLLRRLTKVQRVRSKGLLDVGDGDASDGGDGNGGGDGGGDATTDAVAATSATGTTDGPDRTDSGPDGTDASGGFEWGERSRG